jgi:PadR family transcriptional regulator
VQTLGDFEQLVLLALIRCGEDAYGVPIHQEIVSCARRDVSLGAVYKTLDRLERKGLVASHVGEPTAERGGRRRKHYRIRPAGAAALKQSVGSLKRMVAGLGADLELP